MSLFCPSSFVSLKLTARVCFIVVSRSSELYAAGTPLAMVPKDGVIVKFPGTVYQVAIQINLSHVKIYEIIHPVLTVLNRQNPY